MEIIPSRSYIAPCSKSARRFDVGPLLAVVLTSLLFLANPRATAHAQTIQPYGSVAGLASWALDFQDEFLGFDSARWTTCPYGWTPPTCVGYDEALYQPYNVWVAPSDQAGDGMLVLTARREPAPIQFAGNSYPFTSGFASTHRSYSYKFGYLETRLKLPAGKGLWPALWAVSASEACPQYDSYEAQSEIDVFEGQGINPGTAYLSLHWPTPNTKPNSCRYQDGGSLFPDRATSAYMNPALPAAGYADDRWHVFGVDWRGDDALTQIDWYVDGVLAKSATLTGLEAARFNARSLYLIANLGVGAFPGTPANLPDGSTPSPAKMLVDYVRIWKRIGPPPQNQPSFSQAINLVANGNFARGSLAWVLDQGDAAATLNIVNEPLSVNPSTSNVAGAVIHVANAGGVPQPWEPSLHHALPKGVVAGKSYELIFEAETDAPHSIQVLLQHDGFRGGGWAELSSGLACASPQLTTRKQLFRCTLVATTTDPLANLVFRFGGAGTGGTSVVLSYVSFKDAGAELILNGDFSQGQNAWTLSAQTATAMFYILQASAAAPPQAARVHVDSVGNTGLIWAPSLYQTLSGRLLAGQPYRLSFTARTDAARTIATAIQHDGFHGGGWAEAAAQSNCNVQYLTTQRQTYICVFVSAVDDERVNLVFRLGGAEQAGSNVYLDDVRVEPAIGVPAF